MIFLFIGLSIFTFITGFILGYWFLRSKCFFGGILVLDEEEKMYTQIESPELLEEGNWITFKIISEKQK